MKRLKPWVLSVIFFLSCTKTTPENIIPEEKMIRVLTDVHIADGNTPAFSDPDSVKQRMSAYLKAVYQKHKIDSAKFRRSLQYYSRRPELLQEMYGQVEKNLIGKEKMLIRIEETKRKRLFAQKKKVILNPDTSLSKRTVKNDTVILLKPAVPVRWDIFRAYQNIRKKDPAEASRNKDKK